MVHSKIAQTAFRSGWNFPQAERMYTGFGRRKYRAGSALPRTRHGLSRPGLEDLRLNLFWQACEGQIMCSTKVSLDLSARQGTLGFQRNPIGPGKIRCWHDSGALYQLSKFFRSALE